MLKKVYDIDVNDSVTQILKIDISIIFMNEWSVLDILCASTTIGTFLNKQWFL